MTFDADTGQVGYRSKRNRSGGSEGAPYEALDFLARLLMHIPEPRLHLIRYVGAYSSVSRARRRSGSEDDEASDVAVAVDESPSEEVPCAAERRRLRRQWARMLRRIFEVDPLLCDCGSRMRILSFITSPSAIKKILTHLDSKVPGRGRDPPGSGSSSEEPAS